MTTPQTMGRIVQSLQLQLEEAQRSAAEAAATAPNSYGAGYDGGYADALMSVLSEIEGPAVSNGHQGGEA